MTVSNIRLSILSKAFTRLSATNATPARKIRGGRCASTTGRRNRFISPAYIFYTTAPMS